MFKILSIKILIYLSVRRYNYFQCSSIWILNQETVWDDVNIFNLLEYPGSSNSSSFLENHQPSRPPSTTASVKKTFWGSHILTSVCRPDSVLDRIDFCDDLHLEEDSVLPITDTTAYNSRATHCEREHNTLILIPVIGVHTTSMCICPHAAWLFLLCSWKM